LPSGIDVLLGNDLCPSLPTVDVAVVYVVHCQLSRIERPVYSPLWTLIQIFLQLTYSQILLIGLLKLTSLVESSVAAETIPFELMNRTELIRLQQSDTSLSSLFELADKGDDRYFIKSGVLFRTWCDKFTRPECGRPTIVVPTSLRLKVFQSAHAGHLGVSKTRSSLLQHFCWPSIFRDTKNFCRH